MPIISNRVSENTGIFSGIIGFGKNFDIINKPMEIGERLAEFYMIDGFVKDDIMEKLLESFSSLKKEDMPATEEEFVKKINYTEIRPIKKRRMPC